MPPLRPLKDTGADDCDMLEMIRIYSAMIRFHFKENPESLDDEDFAERVRELRWLSDEGFFGLLKG